LVSHPPTKENRRVFLFLSFLFCNQGGNVGPRLSNLQVSLSIIFHFEYHFFFVCFVHKWRFLTFFLASDHEVTKFKAGHHGNAGYVFQGPFFEANNPGVSFHGRSGWSTFSQAGLMHPVRGPFLHTHQPTRNGCFSGYPTATGLPPWPISLLQGLVTFVH